MRFLSLILSFVFTLMTSIGIFPPAIPAKVTLEEIECEDIVFSNSLFNFSYKNGKFSVVFDGVTMIADATAEYKLGDRTVSSTEYSECLLSNDSIIDERGKGVKLTATLKGEGLPLMKQNFTFYDNTNYFLISTRLVSEEEIASNYIAPLVVKNGNVQNGNPRWTNFLEVPFDNDAWATYETRNLCESGLSHEVGAFFTPDSGDGMIIGSVNHDTWKSAVEYKNRLSTVDELYIYSGANTKLTRDQSPHGTVIGEEISSATFFVGFYDNWKNGMNEYARINTTFTPKRPAVIDSNPIGWNSWGAIQDKIDYSKAVGTSDYIKNNFQDVWQNEGDIVYVNIDSFWDNMTDEELRNFVKHCEANGQVAGVYSSPFVMWWDEYGMQNNCVPGTDITYNEIRLKKADGTYYGNDIDGCYPLDVTHPATAIHFKTQLQRLMNCGFKYIKLDFLVHGSLEGIHYNKDIQTGIQAYNYAMNEVCKTVGDNVFINLSMAPIFPYNYANGRRLACDSFYGIGDTEYMLNSLTYGFWQSKFYDYIDPDHIVLWGKDGKASEAEARSRMVSGIITGGSFLAGDDFISPVGDSNTAFARYQDLLGNKKLIEILKYGEPFEGILSTNCEYAANIFTLEKDEKTYIAVLNYSSLPRTFSVDLPSNKCNVENLFTGEKQNTGLGKMFVALEPCDSVIFEITVK